MGRIQCFTMSCIAGCVLIYDPGAQSSRATDEAIQALAAQAEAIRPLIETDAVRALLDEVPRLPAIETRTVWVRRRPRAALSEPDYEALPESEREGYEPWEFDTERYYSTFYGTPLASLRAFDLVAQAGGIETYRGRRVMDIGFGTIGQLRLLAQDGAHAFGVDVQPIFDVLYRGHGDCGPVETATGTSGSIDMAIGLWPRDTSAQVGGGYDLIISKNTLKKGYATPDEVQPGRGIDLSVTPDAYVAALAKALRKDGLMIIYNIGPGPAPDGHGVDDEGKSTYLPMADIRCPFTVRQFDAAGFEVLALDVDDTEMIRRFARAFGWDDAERMGGEAMKLENDLFAKYTIVRKKVGAGP